MYEENVSPLADGDFSTVFAERLAPIQARCHADGFEPVRAASVVRWADAVVQPYLGAICRRLLLPGSGIVQAENLAELTRLAREGHSCIVCLNHRSNLDVPTLYALLDDQSRLNLFHRIVWISGRKLEEDTGPTRCLVRAVNRVIVSPWSWMSEEHSAEELHEAHQINDAAHRAMHQLRHQGWVFALFPAGTRARPHDASTAHAIEETDSYLKHFEFMLLGRIDGCTMPVSRDHDLTHETPSLDTVRYTFGSVLRTEDWRAAAAERYPTLDRRAASARAIMEDIMALEPAGG
jgi:Acyltransferase